ncbi:MAG TPA: Wzz/FepE/Etk N-terminal domain-containing protein [Balneolaceae bacterium]
MEEWDGQKESEGEIDLVKLGQHIWSRRSFIAKMTGVFVVLGLLIALLMPVEYESSSTMLIEEQEAESGVSQIMQRFGLGAISTGTSEGLPSTLYPEIIKGLPFQMNLIGKEISFAQLDTTVDAYTYFNTIHEPSAFDYIYKYTIGLPWQIKGLLFGDGKEKLTVNYSSSLSFKESLNKVYNIGGDTLKPVSALSNRITVTAEGNLLEVVAEMPDPLAAAEVGQNTVELLKEYIKGYKTKKATSNLEYAQRQLESAREEFETAQQHLAEFKDSNINIATATAEIQLQRLQSEYELAFNVFNSLALKVEDLKLKVQEETPTFTVIHPFEVSSSPSQPNTELIIFISLFFGFFLSIAFVIGRMIWKEVFLKSNRRSLTKNSK